MDNITEADRAKWREGHPAEVERNNRIAEACNKAVEKEDWEAAHDVLKEVINTVYGSTTGSLYSGRVRRNS